jgi:hypothetical protein
MVSSRVGLPVLAWPDLTCPLLAAPCDARAASVDGALCAPHGHVRRGNSSAGDGPVQQTACGLARRRMMHRSSALSAMKGDVPKQHGVHVP